MRVSRRILAVAAAVAVCLLLLTVPLASAAPGDVDRSFADQGRLRVAPLGPVYQYEAALDFVTGPKGETYVLRQGVNCPQDCSADLLVTRYRFDGAVDTTFGQGGTAKAINTRGYGWGTVSVDAKGRPLVAMEDGRIVVVRLMRDGSVDRTFATNTSEFCGCFASIPEVGVAANGDLIVSARAEEWFGTNVPPEDRRGWAVFLVARFGADGQLDPNYGDGGQALVAVRGEVNTSAVQPDGGILLGGSNDRGPFVRRVDSSGHLDSGFVAGFKKVAAKRGMGGGSTYAVVARPNGGAVAFVSVYSTDRAAYSYAVGLNREGRTVPSFGQYGLQRLPMEAALAVRDPRGRIFVEGRSVADGSLVMRLRANGRRDRTFGDGRPIELDSEYQSIAMGRGSRPMLFDLGNRSFRSYSPPKPVILRLRGGPRRDRVHH